MKTIFFAMTVFFMLAFLRWVDLNIENPFIGGGAHGLCLGIAYLLGSLGED